MQCIQALVYSLWHGLAPVFITPTEFPSKKAGVVGVGGFMETTFVEDCSSIQILLTSTTPPPSPTKQRRRRQKHPSKYYSRHRNQPWIVNTKNEEKTSHFDHRYRNINLKVSKQRPQKQSMDTNYHNILRHYYIENVYFLFPQHIHCTFFNKSNVCRKNQ